MITSRRAPAISRTAATAPAEGVAPPPEADPGASMAPHGRPQSSVDGLVVASLDRSTWGFVPRSRGGRGLHRTRLPGHPHPGHGSGRTDRRTRPATRGAVTAVDGGECPGRQVL